MELAEAVVENGVSGSKPWRERELGRAIEACERAEVGGIVVAFQDRLSRESPRGTAEVWEALEAAGARLVCAAEGLDTDAGDHELSFTIKAAIARDQWKRYRRNWADARRNAVARGMHPVAHTPFGYLKDADRRLVPDASTAPLVGEVFRMRATGASWSELVRFLTASGATPTRGRLWTARNVSRIIANRAYLGEARSGEFVNPDAHPSLVSRATWIAAQTKQPGRITRGPIGALLAGLVECAGCEARLTPTGGAYRCLPRRSATREQCGKAYARMDALDDIVVTAFVRRYEERAGWFDDERRGETLPMHHDLVRELERARDTMGTLTADTASLVLLSPANRAALLGNAQAAVDSAQAALDAVQVEAERSLVSAWKLGAMFEPGGFHRATIPDQRRILRAGIGRIVVRRSVDGKREPLADRVALDWLDG